MAEAQLGNHSECFRGPCNCHECTQARWKSSFLGQMEMAFGVKNGETHSSGAAKDSQGQLRCDKQGPEVGQLSDQ